MAAIYEDNHHSRTLKFFYHDNCDLLLVYDNCSGSIKEKWYFKATVNLNEHCPCKIFTSVCIDGYKEGAYPKKMSPTLGRCRLQVAFHFPTLGKSI